MPKLEPIASVINRLLRLLRDEFPGARPFEDWQRWTFPIHDAPLPSTFGVVIAAAETEDTVYQFAGATLNLSVRGLKVTGPPRIFVMGWEDGVGAVRIVSTEIWYQSE